MNNLSWFVITFGIIAIIEITFIIFGIKIIILIFKRLSRNKDKKRKYSKLQPNHYQSEWKDNEETKHIESFKTEEIVNQTKPDYSQAYQARYLLTKNEWYEYKKLRDFAESKELRVCPKVRLLDLVEPRNGEGYMSLLGKIQSKHVDFVITDKELRIRAIIELDDNSHNRPDRQERDNFVNEVLSSVGYKVIRTRSITEDIIKNL